MAANVDQVAAPTTSGASEPPKAPEDAQGLQATEDKPAVETEPVKIDEPASSNIPVGTAADGASHEETAPKEKPRSLTEPVAADKPVETTAPVGAPANGEKHENISSAEDAPTITGALPDAPNPSDLTAAPAPDTAQPVDEGTEEEASKILEKPSEETPATKINGAEKDVGMADAPAAPEENANAAMVGDKRKAEEPAPTNGQAKKAKSTTNGSVASTNGNGETKKSGRAGKKDKKPLEKAKEAIGRTLRKTRSQGPVDQ